MGRKYRRFTPLGRSAPRVAIMQGRCCGCGELFIVGDEICFDSIPWHKARYHAECPSVQEAHPSAVEDVPEAPRVDDGVEAPRRSDEGSIDAIIDRRIARALGATGDELDEDTIKALVERYAPRVDEESIKALVAKHTAPSKVTIEVKGLDQKVRKVEGAHYLLPRLLKLLGAGFHVYLWGPAGSGKTTAAQQAAVALGRGAEIDTLDPTTPKSSILGYRSPDGKPVQTAFTRCYGGKAAGIYIADECDNAPAHVQTLFNSALANGHAPTAWGMLDRSDLFGFAGTGNTPGFQTPTFPDRRPMSAAFKDRLYFMFWPLDPAIECRAGGLPVPPAPRREERTCEASAWVTWVREVRAWAERNAPTLMVTPRASIEGVRALALGETPAEIAHGLVFRGADAALVSKVLGACPLP
jgi:hypothetical protein